MNTTAAERTVEPARNVALDRFTTFRVPATAARFVELRDTAALPDILPTTDEPVLILGGGSNMLLTHDFPGLVVRVATRGIAVERESQHGTRLRVAAGENWDAFVRWSLEQGYCGLENLILIPGSVGAAPIQNIGAYGVELAEFVAAVEVWDREERRWRTLSRDECGFAYRDSRFKRERGRFVVTELVLDLPRHRPLVLGYAGLREELAAMETVDPAATDVAAAVERLRRRKLPDPAVIGNAGSFFQNPIVSAARAAALESEFPSLPVFPLGEDRAKLSAAWLIEQCGFKGLREGDAGVSEKHALVLVNHGSATGAEIWSLAQRIKSAVLERFACELKPEPLVL